MKPKVITRSGFFDKMRFLLSFRYSESECLNIMKDYEEWFEEENQCGKADAQICSNLGSPAEVVKKITLETKSEESKVSILLHNPFLRFVCVTWICIWLELAAYRYWELYSWNYFYSALWINAGYFICGMAAAKGKCPLSLVKREHFMAVAVLAATLLLNTLSMMAGDWVWGVLAVRAHTAIVCLLYAVTLIWGGRNVLQRKHEVYMQALHALGLASALIFIITQYHTLYQSREEFVRVIVSGSGGIYLETVFFVILFGLLKKGSGLACPNCYEEK